MVFSFQAGVVEFTISGNQYYQGHDLGKNLSTKTWSDTCPRQHAWINRLVFKMSFTAVCHWYGVGFFFFILLRISFQTPLPRTPVCIMFMLNLIPTCRPEPMWAYCTLSVYTRLYQPITGYGSLNDAWASNLRLLFGWANVLGG